MSTSTCFVCLEDTNEKICSSCETYAHLDCWKQYINSSPHGCTAYHVPCPICKEKLSKFYTIPQYEERIMQLESMLSKISISDIFNKDDENNVMTYFKTKLKITEQENKKLRTENLQKSAQLENILPQLEYYQDEVNYLDVQIGKLERSLHKEKRKSAELKEQLKRDRYLLNSASLLDDAENIPDQLRLMGITALKQVAKSLGIKGYSKYRTSTKFELINIILDNLEI